MALTVIRLVRGACVSDGVQVKTPLLESRLTPAGAETRLKVRLLTGRSVSLAELVTTNVLSFLIVWSATAASTGALFTSFTITVKLLLSLRAGVPLSVTLTVIRIVLGPCASVGVQVRTPLPGSRLTPAGQDP